MRHLGRNWSNAVTVKQGHELVMTGSLCPGSSPHLQRHSAGFLGTAMALSQVRGVIGVVLIFLVLWAKLRLEEEWMRSQFGETYATYVHQTAALVPYIL
jgi:protein-S-isoprenylcysteine O-methyltransferase Ste14